MSTSVVHRSVLAVPLAAALATGLSACNGPAPRSADAVPATAPASGTAPSVVPSSSSSSASASPSPSASKLNGTESNGLTISDGSRFVVMDGKRVDFGTEVHDLAWSPDGKKAAFVDDSGSLVVSGPDGTGRTTVAKNPGGQIWTHPTWQVNSIRANGMVPARSNILFVAETNGVLRLVGVKSTASNGSPQPIRLGEEWGNNITPLPQTGNLWPSGGGENGAAVYGNRKTGEIFIRDDYIRQQGRAIGKGSEPALSPDGEDIVFVRAVDGHSHLFESDKDGEGAHDLTPKAVTDYAAPVFSRDGKTIAARTDKGIVTLPADGSAAPTLVSEYTGTPAYRG